MNNLYEVDLRSTLWVDFLDHDLLWAWKIHIKIYPMKGQQKFDCKVQTFWETHKIWKKSASCFGHLLGIWISKLSKLLTSLFFQEGHEKYLCGPCHQFYNSSKKKCWFLKRGFDIMFQPLISVENINLGFILT